MLSGLFAVVGRLMLALIFILAGAQKLGNVAGTAAYMESAGLPGSLALPAALFELIAGIAIALGIFTRLSALALAGFTLLATLMFHNDFSDQIQAAMALKNIAIAGGLLCLVAYDQKRFSFDAYRERRRAEAARVPTDHPGAGAG